MDWVKEKMNQARLQRNRLQEHGQIPSPDDRVEGDEAIPAIRSSRFLPLNQKLFWLAGGIVIGVVVVSMVRQTDPIGAGDELAGNTREQRSQQITLPAPSNTNDMKEELVNLSEQVQVLNANVEDLQDKLLEIHSVTNSIASAGKGIEQDGSQQQLANVADNTTQLEGLPPPAAGLDNTKTSEGKATVESAVVTASTHPASIEQHPVAKVQQPQETIKESGPWVINLVSLPHKADAERFVEKAISKGVDAGLYQVTVKGKTYWRVHVPGFATSADAKSNADVIKEKIGLKEVWVAKR